MTDIKTVGVIGAGQMGAGIAQVAAQAGGNDQLLHPSEAAIAKVHEQSKRFSDGQGEGIQRHWDALIRQLDREGRDYQD